MGSSTILDILGSIIIGGAMLLVLFRLNDRAVENSFINGAEVIAQQNIVEVVTLLEHDFRKIGYCNDWSELPVPTKSILTADSTRIKFLTDLDSDGNVDTLEYYLGTTSELIATPNPNDRLLYRVENNESPQGANLGITEFKLLYFNSLGDTIYFPITEPGEVHTLQIDISTESTSGYDNKYTTVFWRQLRLAARNLGNR